MARNKSRTVKEITGTIEMADGSKRSFSIGTDFGWQQWGETQERLGNSVDTIEAMVKGLRDEEVPIVSDYDEEEEEITSLDDPDYDGPWDPSLAGDKEDFDPETATPDEIMDSTDAHLDDEVEPRADQAYFSQVDEALDEATYKIVRFFADDRPSEVVEEGVTLARAKEHCGSPHSQGDGWFDGFRKEA